MGIGDWELGIGHWALGMGNKRPLPSAPLLVTSPQSPVPSPQSLYW
ncbi:hypothetical protein [Nostoc sp. CMAA1605]|nr:hypothetical protein [Nostoc sp. CMAA1605]